MATSNSITETQQQQFAITSLRFPRELWAEVKIAAVNRRTTAQQLVMDATREFLKRRKK